MKLETPPSQNSSAFTKTDESDFKFDNFNTLFSFNIILSN